WLLGVGATRAWWLPSSHLTIWLLPVIIVLGGLSTLASISMVKMANVLSFIVGWTLCGCMSSPASGVLTAWTITSLAVCRWRSSLTVRVLLRRMAGRKSPLRFVH